MARTRTNPRTAFGERLAAAIEWSGLGSLNAFREATDTSTTAYRSADIGSPPPRIDTVEHWAAALGVSAAWLAFGGVYPREGRARVCVSILRRLPEPWLGVGRFREILVNGDASEPTASEWAWIVESWLAATNEDLPFLAAAVAGIRAQEREDELLTKRFYPGLAEFLSKADDPPVGPTAEEKAALRSLQFPVIMGSPSPDAFRVLWEDMRNHQRVRAERRRS